MGADVAPEPVKADLGRRCTRSSHLEQAARDAECRIRVHDLDAGHKLGVLAALARGQAATVARVLGQYG